MKMFMLKSFDIYKMWLLKCSQKGTRGQVYEDNTYLSALDKVVRESAGPDLVVFIIGAL